MLEFSTFSVENSYCNTANAGLGAVLIGLPANCAAGNVRRIQAEDR